MVELDTIKKYLQDEISVDNLGKEQYNAIKDNWTIDELANVAFYDNLAKIVFSYDNKKAWLYTTEDSHTNAYNGYMAMLFDSDIQDYNTDLGFSEKVVKTKVSEDVEGDNEDVYYYLFSNCDTLTLSPE